MKSFASFTALLATTLLAALPVSAKDWLSINGAFPAVATNIVITQRLSTNQVVSTNNLGVVVTNPVVTTVPSTNSTVYSNKVGVVFDMVIGNGKARATLTCTNASPYTNLQLVVGGVTQAAFTGNIRSNANLWFQNFPAKDRLYLFPLTFDPRNQLLIVSNGATYLTLTIGTPQQSPDLRYQESTDLTRMSGTGTAEMSYDQTKLDPVTKLGLRTFRVTLKGAARGTHDVFVAGSRAGSLEVKGNKGVIVFKAPFGNNDDPLDFDPRGKVVEVRRTDGTVLFSGILRVPLVLSPAP